MTTVDGKFTLFAGPGEFATWLNASSFSRVVNLLQCHHTYIPSYDNFHGTNQLDLLHAMEAAHLQRGFSEIAQNLTTFPDGTIAACRPIDTMPAGIKGANKNGICMENVGDFDVGHDEMNAKHRDCIVSVFAVLCKKFNLHPDSNSIVYHHWYDLTTGVRTDGTGNTKTCPGTAFFGENTVQDAEANFIPLVAQQAAFAAEGIAPVEPLYTAEVNADVLNVRSQPALSAGIVKQLTRSVEISVYQEQANWCRIDQINSWWVDGTFLTSTALPVRAQALYAAQVTASSLNVRTSLSALVNIATQLPWGANVYVFEERDGWCRISPADSLWANGSYLARVYSTSQSSA
jgi:SH3-like domain-containing protein